MDRIYLVFQYLLEGVLGILDFTAQFLYRYFVYLLVVFTRRVRWIYHVKKLLIKYV